MSRKYMKCVYVIFFLFIAYNSVELNRIVQEITKESQKNFQQIEKISTEQNRKMKDIQAALVKLEGTLSTLDVSIEYNDNA